MQNLFVFLRAAPRLIQYCAPSRWHPTGADEPAGEVQIGNDFFGLCVASNEDPAGDDFVIERLKELGLRHVRLDFSAGSRNTFQERFLQRLLGENFRVCLHLVQSFSEAEQMHKSGRAQDTWHDFLAEFFSAYGRKVELIEIGSTCNRRKWSGYTLPGYLTAWQIASEMAKATDCPLAAPNVTDFEPVYNIAILSAMKRKGLLPAVQTDNLFVERANEPEAYDHKIAGKIFAAALRFNLIRKARLLNDIGLSFGVPRTMCSHVSWSLRRIARFLEAAEEKQADYVVRYCCLAAASGALARVYWGPLIGQREGLIDDGTTKFPEIPHVTFYGRAPGNISSYRIRPAYYAFQTVTRFLAGTKYVRKIPSDRGLEIHEFHAADGLLHVCWTINGRRVLAKNIYHKDILERAKCYSRDGVSLDRVPPMISESPLYLMWFGEKRLSKDIENMFTSSDKLRPDPLKNIRFANVAGGQHDFVTRDALAGVCLLDMSGKILDMFSALKSGRNADFDVLRVARNRVWRCALLGRENKIIIKHFEAPNSFRQLLQARKGDKAPRSWNGAQELLRRGIPTPTPVAFFHHVERPMASASWYVCEEFAGGFSVREAFNSFRKGATAFKKTAAGELYNQIALFLRKMHDRGVYFRDLSAGNLLFRLHGGEIEFSLIDTARALFYERSVGLRKRLCDLMRICHPLDWKGRRIFLAKYMALTGRRYRAWMNIPFYYYDLKHWVKRKLR